MVTRNRRTRRLLLIGYVTKKEFNDMQKDLAEKLDEQKTVLMKTLRELRKITSQLKDALDDNEEEDDEEL